MRSLEQGRDCPIQNQKSKIENWYNRSPLFADAANGQRLRQATAKIRAEMPFDIVAAVVLPDHLHFVWGLGEGDDHNYSKRVGRLKVLFTRSQRGQNALPQAVSTSRRKHRESDVWQRRFWEHTIRDETEEERYVNYVHYNPVKHGFAGCPHAWPYSSFHRFVEAGLCAADWGCGCKGRVVERDLFGNDLDVGE
jgi:putative transposase